MIRRPPRSTPLYSSAASDVYKRQLVDGPLLLLVRLQNLQELLVCVRIAAKALLDFVHVADRMIELHRRPRYRLQGRTSGRRRRRLPWRPARSRAWSTAGAPGGARRRQAVSRRDDRIVDVQHPRAAAADAAGARRARRRRCLLYTSPSPRDQRGSRMPSSA